MEDLLIVREVEIGSYLLRGLSAEQIAERMGLAGRLVEAYIHDIRHKLDVADSAIRIKSNTPEKEESFVLPEKRVCYGWTGLPQ